MGRLPVVYVLPDGSTTDVDNYEGYDGRVYQIDLKSIEQACGKTIELDLIFAILEQAYCSIVMFHRTNSTQDPRFASHSSMSWGPCPLH
jgi:hypothetical protein